MQIVINKQPLYGTVYWDGSDFVYTPNSEFSGNDFYIYTKNDNGKISTHTNYVNPTNTIPVALNPVLNADAYNINEYSLTDLIDDNTLPFGNLIISDLSNPSHGNAYTDGSKIYYKSNTYNSVEYLNFKVSDKQFTIDAALTLLITNGLNVVYNKTANERLNSLSSEITTFITHSGSWESAYELLTSKETTWNSISAKRFQDMSIVVEKLSSDLNSFYSNKYLYDSLTDTVTANSGSWNSIFNSLTTVSTNLFSNSSNWNITYSTVSTYNILWNSVASSLTSLSSEIHSLNDKIDSTIETIKLSTNWDNSDINIFLNTKGKNWNDLYDLLFITNKKKEWNYYDTLIQSFSTVYYNNKQNYDSLYTTVQYYSGFWGDKTTGVSIMSSNSGYWESVYTCVSSNSAKWKNYSGYDNMVNLLLSNSSNWNSVYTYISANSADWEYVHTQVTTSSGDFLTGGSTIDLSARDLTVFGDTYIKGNLSALGGKVTINTDVYTTSGFEIINNGDSDALIVDKNGYNGIGNFTSNNFSVLYVGSNKKVGVNIHKPNTELTVFGDISATGYVYPLYFNLITNFDQNSGKYESTYSYIDSKTSSINSLTSQKIPYDNLSLFIANSSEQINYLISNKLKFDEFYNIVKAQSAHNKSSNDFIAASGINFGVDPNYRLSAANYDFFTSYVQNTSASNLTGFGLEHVFSNNKVISNQSSYIIAQDNFKIISWQLYSQTPTNVSVDVLSGTYESYPTMVSIVGNNIPALDMFFHPTKNFGINLEDHWSTNISKNSIIKFDMTNNTASSAVHIILTVEKT